MKETGNTRNSQKSGEIPVRIPLPFKEQRSANKLREQHSDLSRKINTEVHPVFPSRKIKNELKVEEPKPPIVNKQKGDLCDAHYVGFTSRHLHQRVEENQTIGNRQPCERTTWKGAMPSEIAKNFRVLTKCSNKFYILIFSAMFLKCFFFFIWDLKPKLNKQSDSIRAKLLIYLTLL